MALVFDSKNFEVMDRVQRELAEVLRRANSDRVEAGIAAFALVRLARELVNKYPEETRQMLVEACIVPFFRNEPVDGDAGRIITIN